MTALNERIIPTPHNCRTVVSPPDIISTAVLVILTQLETELELKQSTFPKSKMYRSNSLTYDFQALYSSALCTLFN